MVPGLLSYNTVFPIPPRPAEPIVRDYGTLTIHRWGLAQINRSVVCQQSTEPFPTKARRSISSALSESAQERSLPIDRGHRACNRYYLRSCRLSLTKLDPL